MLCLPQQTSQNREYVCPLRWVNGQVSRVRSTFDKRPGQVVGSPAWFAAARLNVSVAIYLAIRLKLSL